MTAHLWETTRCSRWVQRDECLRCGVQRVRHLPSLPWIYLKGNDICAGAEPDAAERGRG